MSLTNFANCRINCTVFIPYCCMNSRGATNVGEVRRDQKITGRFAKGRSFDDAMLLAGIRQIRDSFECRIALLSGFGKLKSRSCELKREYPGKPGAVYGTLSKAGLMHGNKPTAKGLQKAPTRSSSTRRQC
jgi:hypothetical protein